MELCFAARLVSVGRSKPPSGTGFDRKNLRGVQPAMKTCLKAKTGRSPEMFWNAEPEIDVDGAPGIDRLEKVH